MSIGNLNFFEYFFHTELKIKTISCIIQTERGAMLMSMTETIRIALVKRGNISESELARRMNISPQNLHNKMKRDNFTETDLREIADALGLKLILTFEDPETGERI